MTKAWTCQDYEGGGHVIFADTRNRARTHAACLLDEDYIHTNVRRAVNFDGFAPGPVPPTALLDAGWWLECLGCGVRISMDADDDGWIGAENAVDHGEHVYCTSECRDKDQFRRRITKKAEARAIAVLRRVALREWPRATMRDGGHCYIARRTGKSKVEQVIVRFDFPGARLGPAELRIDDGERVACLSVCIGDREAWEAFVGQEGEQW